VAQAEQWDASAHCSALDLVFEMCIHDVERGQYWG